MQLKRKCSCSVPSGKHRKSISLIRGTVCRVSAAFPLKLGAFVFAGRIIKMVRVKIGMFTPRELAIVRIIDNTIPTCLEEL